jgi:hypothetical protein
VPTTYFFLQLLLFLIASLVCFTIPGTFFLKRIEKINSWEKLVFGTTVGFVLFTLSSYLFLSLKAPYLIIPTVLIADIFSFNDFLSIVKKIGFPAKKQIVIVSLLFLFGTLGQLALIAPSGTTRDGSLFFWGSNAHDASWHMALTNEINSGFPLQNPVFAGVKLTNYHYFSDIAPALFNKYLGLSSLDMYFRFFPLLYSIFFGATAYFLGKRLGKSFSAGIWTYFFTIFGGSFGYIVTLLQGRGIGGESLFWATQVQSSIVNPPQIISNFLVLTFLFLLTTFLVKPKLITGMVILLIVGSLATFKVYAAVPVLAALVISSIWRIFKEHKFDLFGITLGAGAVAAVLYLPNTSASTTFLIFQPWWFVRTMVVEPSRLNWLDLELRRQFYLDRGGIKSILRIIEYEGIAFLIFFFGNLGSRFLGLPQFLKSTRKFFSDSFSQTFSLIVLISLILPLLFLQKGVAGNTAQFLQYFILLFGILAALSVSNLIGKIRSPFSALPITIAIIALTFPTQLGQINDLYKRNPFAKIASSELEALAKIKNEFSEDTVILTPPYDQYLDLKTEIPDIWDWFDTSYVAAFSEKRTYLADIEQVDVMGYNYQERLAFQQKTFLEPSVITLASDLKERGISLLYFPQALRPKADFSDKYFEMILEGKTVSVWKIK